MFILDSLLATPWLLYLSVVLFSLCIGSFLNVVILRLPKMMHQDWRCQCEEFLELPEGQRKPETAITLSSPASTCPSCNHRSESPVAKTGYKPGQGQKEAQTLIRRK